MHLHILAELQTFFRNRRFEWHSCSPYLNPIENLWDSIKRKIRANQNNSANAEQFIQADLEKWTHVTEE